MRECSLFDEPEHELIDGRLVPKLGGELTHQTVQMRWVLAIDAWSGGRGEALHSWTHRFGVYGSQEALLVPDVAYHRRETLEALGPKGSQEPSCAPDAVVEVLSAGESQSDLAWKVGAYLAAGTRVVFVVDPPRRTVTAHDARAVVRFGPGDTVAHASLPGFVYPIEAMFADLYLGD